jgi:hypothetical protein
LEKRDQLLMQARSAAEAAAEARRQDSAFWEAYRKSADQEAGWRCTLSADPAHPVPSDEGRFRGDWGRVVRREAVRLAPKNALDEGERWTMYEVAAVAGRYAVHGERAGLLSRQPAQAEVNDLVLLCIGSTDREARLPPAWQGIPLLRAGLMARIKAPPRIADKRRFDPIHITPTRFYWAVKDVRWRYPEGRPVLSQVTIGKDLGGGRYEIPTHHEVTFVLEVPPALPRREVLVPGRPVWAIMGQPRFDAGLRKLVLTALDLEERYIIE